MKEEKFIVGVYFSDDCVDDLAELEYQTDQEMAEEVMERMEKANPDKLFKLNHNTWINLRMIKAVKIDKIEEEDDYSYEDDHEA